MRSQRDRDEVSIVIVSAILRFAAVLTGGILVIVLLRTLLGDALPWAYAYWPLFGAAAAVAVRYLYRHRQPVSG